MLNFIAETVFLSNQRTPEIEQLLIAKNEIELTHNMYPTDSYFVYVLIMEYEQNVWLKVSFSIIINPTKIFFEIPPCAKKVIFNTEFVFLDLNPHFLNLHFYEVNELSSLKKALRMEEFQKYFFQNTFHHHFQAKNSNFRYIFHFESVNLDFSYIVC